MKLDTVAGPLEISMPEKSVWSFRAGTHGPVRGIEHIELVWETASDAVPPAVELLLRTRLAGAAHLWTPDCLFNRSLPPEWGVMHRSDMTFGSPQLTVFGAASENILTLALSDAFRRVEYRCGVHEESGDLLTRLKLFSVPETPCRRIGITLHLDVRKIFYTGALRGVTRFFRGCGFKEAAVPESARLPFYSTWYSFHQNLFAPEIEEECRRAAGLGMAGVIVDDGWQTLDNRRGYAFCGDWETAERRFPDMASHVAKIRAMGLKYMLWLAVPFIGEESRRLAEFEGKFLWHDKNGRAWVLDPRFPGVRDYLAGVCERIVRDWDVDGLKLDFIDNFSAASEDPARRDGYAGRDCKLVPEGVDRLLSETVSRLKKLKPDILIEFRQNYTGPAVRSYGNMLRAADCPADVLSNRVRTIDLRLSSGGAAVHSDMIMFPPGASAAGAALQLLNVFFAVPQISARLDRISPAQRRMLRHYLNFMSSHRDVLQKGRLKPLHPEMLYPLVYAENRHKTVAVVYAKEHVASFGATPFNALINATAAGELAVEALSGGRADVFSAAGRMVRRTVLGKGLQKVAIPPSGMLILRKQ